MAKITLGVEGMMCPHCEARVNKCITEKFAPQSVTADHESNSVVISAQDAIAQEDLKKVIEEAGYTMTSYKCE